MKRTTYRCSDCGAAVILTERLDRGEYLSCEVCTSNGYMVEEPKKEGAE